MIRETVAPLKSEVQWACDVLRISQNAFARRVRVHPSILSRVLNDKLTSGPAERRVRVYVARLRRRVEAA